MDESMPGTKNGLIIMQTDSSLPLQRLARTRDIKRLAPYVL